MTDRRPQAIVEILETCRGLLDDSIPLIEGCHRIASLHYSIGASESAAFDRFVVLVAVASETDHLPLGEVRQYCSPEWLAATDAELAEATSLYRAHVHKAAKALLRAVEPQAGNR